MEIVFGAVAFGSVCGWLSDAFLPCIFLLNVFALLTVSGVASVVCSAFIMRVDNDFRPLKAEILSFTLLF